jgi:hypothetical protein
MLLLYSARASPVRNSILPSWCYRVRFVLLHVAGSSASLSCVCMPPGSFTTRGGSITLGENTIIVVEVLLLLKVFGRRQYGVPTRDTFVNIVHQPKKYKY